MDAAVYTDTVMKLSTVPSGGTVMLRSIRAGRGLAARLASMGLVPGTTVHVLRNESRGPVVLGLFGGRVMLGRGMAEKVLVRNKLNKR
jgi:ferrous iron transport protein A